MKPIPLNPKPPEQPTERKRIIGRNESVVPMKGGLFMLIFGSVFVIVGAAIVLLGLGIFDLPNAKKNAPPFVIVAAGALFFSSGLFIWLGAFVCFRNQYHHKKVRAEYPDEPAMKDYPWDPAGASYSRLAPVIKSGFFVIFVGFLMVPFNWWAFFSGEGPLPVKLITLLFDAVLIFLVWTFVRSVIQAVRYVPGRVTWAAFPIRSDGPIELFWAAPMGPWSGGHFTLRCGEEYTVTTRSGGKTSTSTVHEEIWSQRIDAGSGMGGAFGEPIRLEYQPPAGLPGTDFSGERRTFWELELELETPGVNRTERFLIPVYSGRV